MLDALFATDLRDWEGATTDKSEDLPLHYGFITCWDTGHNHTFFITVLCLIERLTHRRIMTLSYAFVCVLFSKV